MTQQQILIHQAITFATVYHMGQTRKGTRIPYIVHPYEVGQILTAAGADTEVICAGLLHDTVEDTEATLEDIRALFGDRVAALVAGASEDKSKTWRERKQHTIDYLANKATLDELLLACADKLSNMRAIALDYAELGDQLWERFNANKQQQSWYYGALTDVLEPLHHYDMYWELVNLYQDVFVQDSDALEEQWQAEYRADHPEVQ